MIQVILLVAMILISVSLAGVILLQRSEGGALGMGGGPSGFMTARGAGNLLTRTTSILAVLFFGCAILLTIFGNMERANQSVVDRDAVGALVAPAGGSASQQTPAPTQAPEKKAGSSPDSRASSDEPAFFSGACVGAGVCWLAEPPAGATKAPTAS
ncbi:MAG: preprotein translocase subunit SecG, partial [Brevundimonas sp.]